MKSLGEKGLRVENTGVVVEGILLPSSASPALRSAATLSDRERSSLGWVLTSCRE